MMILVVEDERVLAELLQLFLEEDGYTVAIAANGQDALRQLDHVRPQLILSDVMMPVMDGCTLCRRLHQDSRYCDVPIVLMSAAGHPPRVDPQCYRAFVHKPFDFDELLATVAALTATT